MLFWWSSGNPANVKAVYALEKTKIILDTDLGSDCDDAGALALLHRMADAGKAEILAVTHCASEISGAVTVKMINEFYGRADVPVGRYEESVFLETPNCVKYTRPLMDKYLVTKPMPFIENATKLLRKTLAQNKNVRIVVIGMLNNIAELLKSQPDEISPLNGAELVGNSVKDMYVMGGNFKDLTYSEWNISFATPSAQYVAKHFPRPITYCGFEIGETVLTGSRLEEKAADNPVRFAYDVHLKIEKSTVFKSSSWDPITVYCAVEENTPLYEKSEGVGIDFDDRGCVILEKGGKDCYLITKATDQEVEKEIDFWLN